MDGVEESVRVRVRVRVRVWVRVRVRVWVRGGKGKGSADFPSVLDMDLIVSPPDSTGSLCAFILFNVMIVQVYSHPHVSDGCLLINGPMLVTFAFAVFFSRVGEIECSESCKFSKDGYCDDGDIGSDYDVCVFGTDCEVGLPSKNALSKKQLWCCI